MYTRTHLHNVYFNYLILFILSKQFICLFDIFQFSVIAYLFIH